MTVSGEQDRLLVFNPDSTVSSYGLKTGVWNTVAMKPSALPVGSLQNLTAVADPYTTSVYIPSGYNNGQEMLVYDYATNTYRTESTPALLKATVSMDPLIRYGFAWCESRRTMLLYGGTRASSGPKDSPSMFEYNPGNSQWALVSTGGDFPGDLNSHCMVSAANGTKMVVFGGQNQYNQLSGSIFILDVSTMVWKKGPDLDPSLVRTGMVCAVAGSSFVAWGGDNQWTNLNQLAAPVFYDLKANQWTTSFTSKNANVGDENHLPSSGQGRNDNWVIIGSTVAVAVVMLGIFMLVRYRYFRKSELQTDEETRPMEDDYTRPTSLEGMIFRGPHACYKEKDKDDTDTHCADKEADVPAQECSGGRRGRSPHSLILSANNGHLSFSALSPPMPPQAITPTSTSYQGNDHHAENRPSEYSSFFSKSEQDMYYDSNDGYSACVTLVPTSPSPPTSPYSTPAFTYPQIPIPPKGYSRSIPLEDEKRMLQMQLGGPHNPNSITSGSLPPVPPEIRRSSDDDIVLFRQIGTNVNDSTRSLDIPRRNPQEHPCEDRHHLQESGEREQRKGKLSWLQNRVAKWIGK
ncbi:hypothetical protein BGX31_005577 [Mortierella sp. GBA43]|nr:hypothetical protein BGX31_005577 [Mortierella sp. GBA43]